MGYLNNVIKDIISNTYWKIIDLFALKKFDNCFNNNWGLLIKILNKIKVNVDIDWLYNNNLLILYN